VADGELKEEARRRRRRRRGSPEGNTCDNIDIL